jgi:hypothetical protein
LITVARANLSRYGILQSSGGNDVSKSPQVRSRDHAFPLFPMQTTENVPADVRVLRLRPWVDLASHLEGFDVVSISVGPKGELYVLVVTTPAEYHMGDIYKAPLVKLWADRPHDFRILRYDGHDIVRHDLREQIWNFHYVQPLPPDELLLVIARSRHYTDGTFDLNVKAFTPDGTQKREFLLGDGILDVQTTGDGRIWTSYYDEGIFGNFGWKKPVGVSGFVQWDRYGNRLYEFVPPKGFSAPVTGYGLNGVSDTEMWCCYYTDFPLVRIRHEKINAVWQSPVHGSRGFAIWQDYVLFRGGYINSDMFFLLQVGEKGSVQHRASFRIADDRGRILHITGERKRPLENVYISARGSRIFVLIDRQIYRLEVSEVIARL